MKRRILKLSLLLSLLAIPTQAFAQEQSLKSFFDSKYDYCDAKLIAGLWGESVSEAKATISYKLDHGLDLEPYLAQAREQAREKENVTCTIYEMGYTYEDAAALASNWNMDITEAKAAMWQKMLHQGEDGLRAALEHVGAPSVKKKEGDPLIAFADSDYAYCDAKMMAAYWGVDVPTAKASIGTKIIGGNEATLKEQMGFAFARPQVDCQFYETKYSYEDAEKLAGFWGESVSDAKARIASKVTDGNGEVVDQILMGINAGVE